MDISYYANLAEIFGILALVVSLGYVAVQIRQNTRATRLTSAQNIYGDLRESHATMAKSMGLATIHWNAITDIESLTPAEKHRFYFFVNYVYRGFENAYYQSQQGVLDAYVWEGVLSNLVIVKDTSGYRSYWHDRKQLFSQGFQDFYDNRLPSSKVDALAAYRSAEDKAK